MSFLYELNRIFHSVHTSKIALILSVLSLSIPVIMLVAGFKGLDKCPLNEFIPIWLIIGGVFVLLHTVVTIYLIIKGLYDQRIKKVPVNDEEKLSWSPFIFRLGYLGILVVWLIVASVLSFSNYSRYKEFPELCVHFTFHVIFAKSIMMWIIHAIAIVVLVIRVKRATRSQSPQKFQLN